MSEFHLNPTDATELRTLCDLTTLCYAAPMAGNSACSIVQPTEMSRAMKNDDQIGEGGDVAPLECEMVFYTWRSLPTSFR